MEMQQYFLCNIILYMCPTPPQMVKGGFCMLVHCYYRIGLMQHSFHCFFVLSIKLVVNQSPWQQLGLNLPFKRAPSRSSYRLSLPHFLLLSFACLPLLHRQHFTLVILFLSPPFPLSALLCAYCVFSLLCFFCVTLSCSPFSLLLCAVLWSV